MLKCLLFSLGSKLKEGFPYYSSQFWLHAICCCNNYKVSSRESLNTWHKAHYLPISLPANNLQIMLTWPMHTKEPAPHSYSWPPLPWWPPPTATRSSSFQGLHPGNQSYGASCESLNLIAPWSCPQLPIFLPPWLLPFHQISVIARFYHSRLASQWLLTSHPSFLYLKLMIHYLLNLCLEFSFLVCYFFPPSFSLLQWDPYPIAQTRNPEAILCLQAVLASCIAHLQAASWVLFSLHVAELLPVQGSRVLVYCSLSPSYSVSPHITLTMNASCLPHLPCHKHPPGRRRQVASVVSDSVRPHGLQPTRLLCPWDSPGKNTGVGCHFLLQPTRQDSTKIFFVL